MRHKHKQVKNPCRVFWGTHGCRKQRNHKGRHLCMPACPHPDKYQLYGEDVIYPDAMKDYWIHNTDRVCRIPRGEYNYTGYELAVIAKYMGPHYMKVHYG